MDFLKKLQGKNNAQQNPAGQPGVAPGGQAQPGAPANKDDYGDKAAKAIADKIAPGKTNADQREKLTDMGRNFYTKITGKQVNPKYSN